MQKLTDLILNKDRDITLSYNAFGDLGFEYDSIIFETKADKAFVRYLKRGEIVMYIERDKGSDDCVYVEVTDVKGFCEVTLS